MAITDHTIMQVLDNVRRAPKTLWIFAVLLLIWGIGAAVVNAGWPAWTALALDAMFAVLVLNRVRLAWMFIVAGAIMNVVHLLLTSPHWWLALFAGLLLALLISPPSLRYIMKPSV